MTVARGNVKMRAMHSAPFASRAYGGFTTAQAKFIAKEMGDPAGRSVVDPMCGQAYLAATWAHRGAKVLLADVNPGPLALAGLRDPRAIRKAGIYVPQMTALIRTALKRRPRASRSHDDWAESLGWLPDAAVNDLNLLGGALGINGTADLARAYKATDGFGRFAIGIAALAARRFATFRLSDNLTWLRPGGIPAQTAVDTALGNALSEWQRWAGALNDSLASRGAAQTRLASVSQLAAENRLRESADFLVTSPPYANRLDYRRLWAPETAAVMALCGRALDDVQGFIGGNEIQPHETSDIAMLPRSVRSALSSIKQHPSWGSAHYYHPFFSRYAIEMHLAFTQAARLLKPDGRALVFGRDTVRKDTLFPTIDIVVHAMRSSGVDLVSRHGEIIRSHVGNMRRISDVGLFGKAQREWWLVLRKR